MSSGRVDGGERPRRRRGRPLNRETDRAILEAAANVLGEKGFPGLTMDEIAGRAGVGKTTIYRRWSSKEALIVALLRSLAAELPDPDTGSVRDDLVTLVDALNAAWMTKPAPLFFRAMISEVLRNEALREGYAEVVAGRRQRLRAILDRGIARGEVRADIDREAVLDMIVGAAAHRLLIVGDRVPPGFAETVVDGALVGIGVSTSGRRSRGEIA